MPDGIKESIAFEHSLLKDIEHRVQRQFSNDPMIFLEAYKPINDKSIMTGRIVNSTKYDIFQDVDGDHVLIGYGIFEFAEMLIEVTYSRFFVLNSRKVPLASYNGSTYKRYVQFKELSLMEHDLGDLKARHAIVQGMAVDLVKRKEL